MKNWQKILLGSFIFGIVISILDILFATAEDQKIELGSSSLFDFMSPVWTNVIGPIERSWLNLWPHDMIKDINELLLVFILWTIVSIVVCYGCYSIARLSRLI